ncbi:MAG: hypothetical protein HYZ57_13460 [Acidobacteria bacterium]|nr:hypothetical protein [Acidobacteriota bacterium]MBI3280840.1 hypothetical protein [Acidobacteriota bacterium]
MPGGPGMPGQPGGQARQPNLNDLKAALGLSDQQVEGLIGLQRERQQANRSAFLQIAERQNTLSQLLSPSADPAALGRVLIDMENLKLQVRQNDERYEQLSRDVLTADQKTKLKTLEDALKLQPAIGQAVALQLIEPPRRGDAPGGPMPRLGFGIGGVMGPGMGTGPLFGPRFLHRIPEGTPAP